MIFCTCRQPDDSPLGTGASGDVIINLSAAKAVNKHSDGLPEVYSGDENYTTVCQFKIKNATEADILQEVKEEILEGPADEHELLQDIASNVSSQSVADLSQFLKVELREANELEEQPPKDFFPVKQKLRFHDSALVDDE